MRHALQRGQDHRRQPLQADVTHRHIPGLLPPVFRRTRRFSVMRAPHRPTGFEASRLNALFQQSVHCFCPVEGRSTPEPATKSPLPPLRCQTQTAVHPSHWVEAPQFRRSLEGASRVIYPMRVVGIDPAPVARHAAAPHSQQPVASGPGLATRFRPLRPRYNMYRWRRPDVPANRSSRCATCTPP